MKSCECGLVGKEEEGSTRLVSSSVTCNDNKIKGYNDDHDDDI
jgi:hypothetical protein